MNMKSLLLASVALVATGVQAQEGGDAPDDALDLTMVLMPEGATRPDAVTRVIELPAAVAEAARESATRGLDTANAARGRSAAGVETAEAAREQSRERAQQGREDVGRGPPDRAGGPGGRGGSGASDPPGNSNGGGPPEGVGPPESPGPPETPGPTGD